MKKSNKEEFIEKSTKKHNNKYDYSLVEYKNSKTKVKIICKKHSIFEQKPNDHLSGQGCPKCKKEILSKLKKYTTEDFINLSQKTHGNKYDYSLSIYDGTEIEVKIICHKHGIFNQTPHNHISGQGCPICKKENFINCKRFTSQKFIDLSNKVHKNKYDYSLINYKNNKTKVEIICKKHGIFEQKPILHMLGSGCPKCKSSKGEQKIIDFLNDNEINYLHQKIFDKCKFKNKLRFDFYLPDFEMVIEYDGEQHFKCNDFFGGKEEFEKLNIKDEIKNNFCDNSNINLLRISYKDIDKIEQILNNNLKLTNYEKQN